MTWLSFPATKDKQQSMISVLHSFLDKNRHEQNIVMSKLTTCFYFLSVSIAKIKECFTSNTTLIDCGNSPDPLIDWFASLNTACKAVGASKLQRQSVPHGQFWREKMMSDLFTA